jgi:hypothetical protein
MGRCDSCTLAARLAGYEMRTQASDTKQIEEKWKRSNCTDSVHLRKALGDQRQARHVLP